MITVIYTRQWLYPYKSIEYVMYTAAAMYFNSFTESKFEATILKGVINLSCHAWRRMH